MIYRERDLGEQWTPQIRFTDGDNVNLVTIRKAIQWEADNRGVPVSFREEQLKTGTLFNKQIEDVLVMYHPDHRKDYLNFLIHIQHMGRYAFMNVYQVGESKNLRRVNASNAGGGQGFLSGLSGMIRGTSVKFENEKRFYAMLSDIISSVIG